MNVAAGAMVLAGGRSHRMGTDKNWLDAGGTPLLVRVLEVVVSVCHPVVVVATRGQHLPGLPPKVIRLDDPPEQNRGGPLIAVAHALQWLSDHQVERSFMASCDLARVSAAHINCVIDSLDREDVDAVLPVEDTATPPRLHPLAGAVRVAPVLPIAQQLLAAGERRLLALFTTIRMHSLPAHALPDPTVLRPCNTPQQWHALRMPHGSR